MLLPAALIATVYAASDAIDAVCSFDSGQDCFGGDLFSKSASTPEHCCDLCSGVNGCTAFTYDEYNAHGQRQGTCYLKNSCSNKTECGTCTAGQKHSPAPAPPRPSPSPTPSPSPRPSPGPGQPNFHKGLNLPRTRFDTNDGNFRPGVFEYDYTAADISRLRASGFTAIRLGINVDTALNRTAGAAVIKKMRSYADQLGGAAIICMWDTLQPGQSGHGDGRVNNVTTAIAAWRVILEAFSPPVKFEIFNEPFGYKSAGEYFQEMTSIVKGAALPIDRVILDGNGYAVDVKSLNSLGWEGLLAYHFYPNWVPVGHETDDEYAARVMYDLEGIANRVFITEFGSDLSRPDYNKEDKNPSDGGAVN